MFRYIIKRLLWMIAIMVSVAILIFTLMFFAPGDPVETLIGSDATEVEKEAIREEWGLNDPFIVQLGRYLYDTFIRLDLGTSYTLRIPVIREFASRLPRTLALGLLCVAVEIVIGIPLGILAANRRNKLADKLVMLGAAAGVSVPGFWLGLLMVMLFSVKLGWLPPFGIGTWKHWIMPIIAGSVSGVAMTARQTRSAVLEVIRADYVTTARAKGLSESTVTYKHMLPNALIPIINSVAGRLSGAIAGTVVVETVFTFPGIGTLLSEAVSARDYPTVRSCVLILALFSAFVMLFVDLIYAYIDPRIKAQYTRRKAKRGGTRL